MPDWKSLVRARLRRLDTDPARAADIIEELAQHVAQHYGELVAGGMPEAEALSNALAPLDAGSDVAAAIARADRVRLGAPPPPPTGSGSVLADARRDIAYAGRLLLRAPGFAAAAVVTLALGIGANAAIFSVLNAVLLRPLPYADSDRLTIVGDRDADGAPGNVGYLTFLDWRDRAHAFEQMALFRFWSPSLVISGQPERAAVMRVSWNFFRTLGIQPALGRDFVESEDKPNTPGVLLISDGLWRRRFDANPAVVGRVVTLSDRDFTIIGVMPRQLEPLISERYYQPAEMWAPLAYDRTLSYACRSCQHLKTLARLKPGAALDAARSDMDAVQEQLRHEHPSDYPPLTMAVKPLREELTGRLRPVLVILMAAVACVLLIACANVANLLLARMARREHDLALRSALGAGRSRLVRQLLTENALLAAAGGAGGVLLSVVAAPALVSLAPSTMARLTDVRLDARVIIFAIATSALTALVFGLLPAIRGSKADLRGSLHADRQGTSSAPTAIARRLLVAADVAVAVVLLVGAGLMIKTVGRLLGVNPGFDPDRVLTMQVSMVGRHYAQDETVVRTGDAILDKVRAVPGVAAAALAGQIPLGGNGDRWGFHIEGRPIAVDDPSVERYSVTPEYFPVMRIPLRRGRLFTDADRAGAERTMLVGEQTARTLWPNADPIGQHVRIGGGEGPPFTIVGIVGDVRHQELAKPPTLQMYTAQRQVTDSLLTLVVRTTGDPAALAGDVRRAVSAAASDVPITQISPLDDLVAASVAPRRFMMLLLEVFAAIAVVMTAVGIYGVIAYSVSERTREIGVRAALGASRRDIARLVVGGGLPTIVAGLGAGTALAAGATRYLESSLFGVSTIDPTTFAAVPLLLLAVALLAQSVPVVRAMRIDPGAALRQE